MEQIKDFNDVHKVLARFLPPPHSIHEAYTLDRITKLMEFLGNPQDTYKTIHIAGTSGKTSTAYYLSSILIESGSKVGLTVSPHIDEVNERVQIQGEPINEADFCRNLQEFLKIIENSGIIPTYFELLVAFAFWIFAREKVDYAVVEVGLGGLLDGTNVINRPDKVCVITDIGLDHTAVLGKTLTEITTQKAGIIYAYNSVFMYEQSSDVMKVVREVCGRNHADLHEIKYSNLKLANNLPSFQHRNWSLAREVYNFLSKRDNLPELNPSQVAETTQIYIPARMEIIETKEHSIILDGAHNSQKFEALVRSVKNQFPKQPVALMIGMLEAKAESLEASLNLLKEITSYGIITSFDTEQDTRKVSIKPSKIAAACKKVGINKYEIIEDAKLAYTALLERPEPVLLVTGSFYLLSHIRPLIKQK